MIHLVKNINFNSEKKESYLAQQDLSSWTGLGLEKHVDLLKNKWKYFLVLEKRTEVWISEGSKKKKPTGSLERVLKDSHCTSPGLLDSHCTDLDTTRLA